MSFDYVVVGAGAAGCVLASRLSSDPAVQVLLVEGGGRGRDPLLAVPRAFYLTLRSKRHTLHYLTQPSPGVPAERWTRGRGLGGSTLINGLMYVRGAAADFDALEAAGNPGWGGAEFLQAYREIEGQALVVSIPGDGDPVTAALFEAAQKLGLRRTADFNDADDARIGFTPATIRRGRRVSAASAFLGPARDRPNLTIVTGARVERILLDGKRAVGVEMCQAGQRREVRARREVLVAAGSIESPLLLERSGVGRPDVLRAAGVVPVVESPNVGERLIEQRAVSMQVRLREGVGPSLNSRPRQAREAARYLATRRGPIATSGYDVVTAFRSSPDVVRPDVQGVWVPIALDENAHDMRLARYPGLLFTGYPIRPTTAGSVHLAADPGAPPVVSPRYLEHPAERAATGAILDHARRRRRVVAGRAAGRPRGVPRPVGRDARGRRAVRDGRRWRHPPRGRAPAQWVRRTPMSSTSTCASAASTVCGSSTHRCCRCRSRAARPRR